MRKFFITFALLLCIPTAFASAAPDFSTGANQPSFQTGASQPSMQTNTSAFALKNPLSFTTVCGLLLALLDVALVIGIPIMVLFLVYAGFLFVLARGSQEGLKKAKANFFYTILGIALFLGAWTLGQIVAATINEVAPGSLNTNSCK
jgi:hypothetical protein